MQRSQLRAATALLAVVLACAGCASSIPPHATGQMTLNSTNPSVALLREEISRLAPGVSGKEARRLSERVHTTARQLARDYRTVGSPHFHNFLVNIGARKRGLCYQWTEDLMGQLFALRLQTVELHWGTARGGTLREHNCVVVTAVRQPFSEGIVLDAWRNSGRLFWSRVADDHYPWHEEKNREYMRRAAVAQHSGAAPRPATSFSPRQSAWEEHLQR